jgi:hypothetical protein
LYPAGRAAGSNSSMPVLVLYRKPAMNSIKQEEHAPSEEATFELNWSSRHQQDVLVPGGSQLSNCLYK